MVRKNKLCVRLAAVLITVLFSAPLMALSVPAMNGRVNDYADIIRRSDENEIEEYLYNLEKSTGIQIAVLTVPSLDGDDIASFGIRVADKWKLGDKEKDNGAILIVAMAEHDVRIEVGDGLEGSLTDAKCGLILRNVVVPEFKDGNYSSGILKGVKNMGGIASGDESVVSKRVLEDKDTSDSSVVPLIVIIIWLIIFMSTISAGTRRRGRHGRYVYSGNSNSVVNAAIAASIARSILNSGSGSSSHHSGGFGGFSGGGGHFSGGGASAHW